MARYDSSQLRNHRARRTRPSAMIPSQSLYQMTLLRLQFQPSFTESIEDQTQMLLMNLKRTGIAKDAIEVIKAIVQWILRNTHSIKRWKQLGALLRSKGITLNSNNPACVTKDVFSRDSASISIFQYPDMRSILEKYWVPERASKAR